MSLPFVRSSLSIGRSLIRCHLILAILEQITVCLGDILDLSSFELQKPSVNSTNSLGIDERSFSILIDHFLMMEIQNRSSDVFDVSFRHFTNCVVVALENVSPYFFKLAEFTILGWVVSESQLQEDTLEICKSDLLLQASPFVNFLEILVISIMKYHIRSAINLHRIDLKFLSKILFQPMFGA
jgi:hypothetical protein